MFNATETYKDRLIQKIKSLEENTGLDSEYAECVDKESWNIGWNSGWNDALQTIIDTIESNDLEHVVHEPHKVNTCKN